MAYKYDNQTLPTGAPSFTRGSFVGRLVAVTYGGASAGNYIGYDQLGRVTSSYQQTDSQNYGFSYGYNLASQMTSETYPSLRQITTTYDAAGRISTVNGQKTGEPNKTYASQFSYASYGAVKSLQLGNSKWEHTNFNSRLQPVQIGLGTSATNSSILQLDYGYGATNANNGNLLTQTITIGATIMSQSYGYDGLNRLSTASEGPAWSQTYDCDRYGNRAVRVGSYVPQPQLTPQSTSPTDFSAFNQATNRIASSGFGYDTAGNLTADPTTAANGISYDAENRQTQYTKSNQPTNYYYYDGDGRRVKKIDGSGTTVFVYNADGQLIAEYTSGTPSGGGTSYLTSDHLGSTRVVTKQDGTVKARYDYLPFGEELGAGIGQRTTGMGYSAADSTKQKFTQKERDNESGLDYFGARYYSSAQGRFTTVDPLGASAQRANPQTMNRYGYALNNPLRFVDPDGMDSWDQLTKKQQDLIAPKLKPEDGQTARDAFNQLVLVKGDEKATNTNTLSIQNFIDQVGGRAAWRQIQTVTGVEHNTPNQDTNQEQSSNIKITIADNAKFLDALGKGGYDVNGIGDTGRKAGQLIWRNLGNVLDAVINSTPIIITNLPNHPFDNARASTPGHNDPQLHFYNEYGGNTFYAHWDATSSNARKDGPIGNIAGGAGHGASASPQRVRQYLKDIGKTPQ